MAEPRRSEPAPGSARRLVIALMVIYLVLLAWMVLWKFEAPYVGAAAGLPRPIKLIPFASSAEAGASAPLEVLANVALFVPFGLYLGLLAPTGSRWRAVGIFVGASALLEIVQHVLSIGSFDITDVITNAAGGMLGLAVLAALRRRLGARTQAVMARSLAIGTAVALVAVAAFVASPLRYAPQHDVVVPRPSEAN